VKPQAMFLRTGCVLPVEVEVIQTPFCERWMRVEASPSATLDQAVRRVGWHFMDLIDEYSCRGFGRTASAATNSAISHALEAVKSGFNAGELGAVRTRKYPGFQVATVTVHARQIQQQATLGVVDEMSPVLSARVPVSRTSTA
jgi:hypothetical protein